MYFSLLRIVHKKQISVISRFYSNDKFLNNVEIDKIRNIGILAHIDAGKTTTTERMLYYAGTIKQMGEVHRGNTVTDYMPQERERGITIRSAAVTFMWKNHQVNLIDTPGHIDFTMEVEQTLNILDGAIVVLDASAGVEAQTQTVWLQADRYKVPKIVFVNKMDRPDADLNMCCQSIKKKLDATTVKLQIPILDDYRITGLVDVLSLEKYCWSDKNARTVVKTSLNKDEEYGLWQEAVKSRCEVVDILASHDDVLAEKVINSGSYSSISTPDIVISLRKSVANENIVPVLCGSAYKNVGIELLLDAVLNYLPTPMKRNKDFKCFGNNLCARAFKIIHDKQKGAITFFRIYSGSFIKGQKVYNIQKNSSEQSSKLYVTFADDYEEIEELSNGNVAAVTGLKHTNSGDLITSSINALSLAKKNLAAAAKPSQQGKEDDIDRLFGKGPRIPEPVFFCSIEPPNLSKQSALEHALAELQREDPSLRVTYDTETGQIILGGMGELHLEIIRDRILKEYKIETQLGRLQIAYREAPLEKVSCELTTEMKVTNNKQVASISLTLIPSDKDNEKGILILDKKPESASNIASIFPKHLAAVRHGIEVGLRHGPKISSQVINVNVMLHMLGVLRGTTEFVIEATATQCVQKLLKQSGTFILEPIMFLEITAPEQYISAIMADLSRRRALVQGVGIRGINKIITTEAPLSELLGYSSCLRSISSGTGTFSMEFLEYRRMSPVDEPKAIESVRGF